MSKLSVTTQLGVSADQVWELIGNFNALPDWHPAVERSELEEGGTVRRVTLAGGASMDSFKSAMIMSIPEASVLVCFVLRSSASLSISGLRNGSLRRAADGIPATPTMDASEK